MIAAHRRALLVVRPRRRRLRAAGARRRARRTLDAPRRVGDQDRAALRAHAGRRPRRRSGRARGAARRLSRTAEQAIGYKETLAFVAGHRAVARCRARPRRTAHPEVRPPPTRLVPPRPAGGVDRGVREYRRPRADHPGNLVGFGSRPHPMSAMHLSKLHATGNDFLVRLALDGAAVDLDGRDRRRAVRPPPRHRRRRPHHDHAGVRRRRLHDDARQRRRWASPR